MAELRTQLQATLGTSYTIERELGGGGMSRVFVAEDTTLGRPVVVKVLPPDMASGVSIERFKREISLGARLQHPHIVALLSAGETGGLPYFTMPFVEGESLRARLTRAGEFPIAEAVRLRREVASALTYAHGKGVAHRTINPENILLTEHHGSHALDQTGFVNRRASGLDADQIGRAGRQTMRGLLDHGAMPART